MPKIETLATREAISGQHSAVSSSQLPHPLFFRDWFFILSTDYRLLSSSLG